jgi:hypothetical protein
LPETGDPALQVTTKPHIAGRRQETRAWRFFDFDEIKTKEL